MSLYNLLHGTSPNAGKLLHALNLDPCNIDRLRDVSFSRDRGQHVVHILCRTGGGNRADYPNRALTDHAAYIRDEDDDYDCTYAHYYFEIPESIREELAAEGLTLDDVVISETLRDKFEAEFDELAARRDSRER